MRHAWLLTLVSAVGLAAQPPRKPTAHPQSTEVRVVRDASPSSCRVWGALVLEACTPMPGCSPRRMRAEDTTPLSRALQSSLDARLARACAGGSCAQVRTRADRNAFDCRGRDELCMTRSIELACIGPEAPTIPARPRERPDREATRPPREAAHVPRVLQAEGSGVRVFDLGTIGPPRGDDADSELQAAPGRTTPLSRDDLLPAARLAGANDVGQTFRIGVHDLLNGPIRMVWRCYEGEGRLNTQGSGHISCDGKSAFTFWFHPLAPNSTYLVTLEHAFSAFELRIRSGESEQTSTVQKPDRPMYLAFKTMPGQTFVSMKLYAVEPGSLGLPPAASFYSLHLSRLVE